MSASGVMPVENEPDFGYPSRSEYVLGPPARQKTRSEKVPESDFGQREPRRRLIQLLPPTRAVERG